MTQIFGDKGVVVPVTVIEAGPCFVTQIKTEDKDGYDAVQLAFEDVKKSRVNKPRGGTFRKAGVAPKKVIQEFRVAAGMDPEYKPGDTITCEVFKAGDLVDITARTKGRGFTGVIKRWNQHRGPMAHGSGYHRGVGSMGANTFPAHVFKNKHMPGQYGNEQVTIQNLNVVRVDKDKNCLLIKGGVPGPDGALVSVRSAIKSAIKVGGVK